MHLNSKLGYRLIDCPIKLKIIVIKERLTVSRCGGGNVIAYLAITCGFSSLLARSQRSVCPAGYFTRSCSACGAYIHIAYFLAIFARRGNQLDYLATRVSLRARTHAHTLTHTRGRSRLLHQSRGT